VACASTRAPRSRCAATRSTPPPSTVRPALPLRPSQSDGERPGESGLDGTTVLPAPAAAPATVGAVGAMHAALSAPENRGRAWVVATGALTNVALLFAVHPRLADDVAGVSVMGGAIGGFFSNAPLGRMRERLELRRSVFRDFPEGLPDERDLSVDEVVRRFRELGILDGPEGVDDEKTRLLLDQARRSFGNSTPYAEFNVGSIPRLCASLTVLDLRRLHLLSTQSR
jgi:hypothetical protein